MGMCLPQDVSRFTWETADFGSALNALTRARVTDLPHPGTASWQWWWVHPSCGAEGCCGAPPPSALAGNEASGWARTLTAHKEETHLFKTTSKICNTKAVKPFELRRKPAKVTIEESIKSSADVEYLLDIMQVQTHLADLCLSQNCP